MAESILNRRRFLIRFGAGLTGGIGGFYLLNQWPDELHERLPESFQGTLFPKLRKDIVFGQHEDLKTIRHGTGADMILCAINRPGGIIIDSLDGMHTIDRIERALKSTLGLDPMACLQAPIAHFVAQLGMLGFLAEPFYATLYYENIETHGF